MQKALIETRSGTLDIRRLLHLNTHFVIQYSAVVNCGPPKARLSNLDPNGRSLTVLHWSTEGLWQYQVFAPTSEDVEVLEKQFCQPGQEKRS